MRENVHIIKVLATMCAWRVEYTVRHLSVGIFQALPLLALSVEGKNYVFTARACS